MMQKITQIRFNWNEDPGNKSQRVEEVTNYEII